MSDAAEKKVFTMEEVAPHNKESDCWLVIGNDKNGGPKVYDVTKYLPDHPGGPEIMSDFAGKDADGMFEDIGHSSTARDLLKKYYIGELYVDPNAVKTEKKKAAAAVVESKGGLNIYAVILLLIAIAVGVYLSQMQGTK